MQAGLYLHIPFCDHKCGYCDFYSATNLAAYGEDFVAALLREIELRAESFRHVSFNTVFFGGGTPSLLTEAQLAQIMDALFANYAIVEGAEITLETNPGTVNREKLALFRQSGINRISFGVQSFHNDELKFMERIHSASEAKANIAAAREVGFDNVSFDLIFALPNQPLSRWEATLTEAVALETPHISAYSLIFEKNTPFYNQMRRGEISPLPEENEREFFEFTMNFLAKNGYSQYEISNYSTSEARQSQHNIKYWKHEPYLGFGPSAHSFDGTASRWWNVRSTEKYIETLNTGELPTTGRESLSSADLKTETIMLGLRMNAGIDLRAYKARFGSHFAADFAEPIEKFVGLGMIRLNKQFCSLTKEGIFYCDEIISQF